MTRVIFRFIDGTVLNLPAECIDIRDGWIMAWSGEDIVAIAKADEIISCHMSEKKEEIHNGRS